MYKTKTINFASLIVIFFVSNSCSKKVVNEPSPIVKVEEPKYIEWSYEAGKDPLLINLFTFKTGIDPSAGFDISDTTKLENVFKGHLEGFDYYNKFQKLDMSKNNWFNQIFENANVKITGHEFSTEVRDEIFSGLKFSRDQNTNLLNWSAKNWLEQKEPKGLYLKYLKPILLKNAEMYFIKNKKKPKYQVSVMYIPLEYYESGFGGTVITFSDGNVLIFQIEPSRKPQFGEIEQVLSAYAVLGHEFAGHQFELIESSNLSKSVYTEYIGKKDQYGNEVDQSGHVNGPAPRYIFHSISTTHLRPDNNNNSLIFPEENKEFLSGFIKDFNPQNTEDHKRVYGNLVLMKTPSEKSNIPYIAEMVKTKQKIAKEFIQNMWTDKILVSKNNRLFTQKENVTITNLFICQ